MRKKLRWFCQVVGTFSLVASGIAWAIGQGVAATILILTAFILLVLETKTYETR